MKTTLLLIAVCLLSGCLDKLHETYAPHEPTMEKPTITMPLSRYNKSMEDIDKIKIAIGYDSNNYDFFGVPYKPHSHLMYQMNKKIDLLIEYLGLEYIKVNSIPGHHEIRKLKKSERTLPDSRNIIIEDTMQYEWAEE